MNKLLALLTLSFALACGGAPPADPPVVQPKPMSAHAEAPSITALSTNLKDYSNDKKEWSIGLPDNMKVIKQDENQVQVQADDGSVMGLLRADTHASTTAVANGILVEMVEKGEHPVSMKDIKIGEWDGKVMIFHETNAPDLKAMTAFSTGSHAYIYLYMGYATRERSEAYRASMMTIVISEAENALPKQTTPAKKTTH